MKATQKDFASLAARAAGQARVFFFCGPDEAGAHDAAARIVSLLPDAGERIELSGSEVKRDPVRLGDEARSTSLFGGTRHIVVRASGDEAHDAVEILLGGEVPPCPVLIVASSASDKSRTAKLLEKRDDALVDVVDDRLQLRPLPPLNLLCPDKPDRLLKRPFDRQLGCNQSFRGDAFGYGQLVTEPTPNNRVDARFAQRIEGLLDFQQIEAGSEIHARAGNVEIT